MKKVLFFAALLAATAGAAAQPANSDSTRRSWRFNLPTPEEMARRNATLDSLNRLAMMRPTPSGCTRREGRPVLFLVGNSTMRQGTRGNGDIGQWGWGFYAQDLFDTARISVENQALGGMSSRSFYRDLWPDVLKGVRKGDYVFIELGHNDNGDIRGRGNKASIKGIGKESEKVEFKTYDGKTVKETVYSFGEYLRRYVADVRKRGATPVLLSLVPRNRRDDNGHVVRDTQTYALWTRQIAEEQGVPFLDLNERIAQKYERYGRYKTSYLFYGDGTHTSAFGARINAATAAAAIRDNAQLSALAQLLRPEAPVTAGLRRKKGRPVVFTIGDSTVKNKDRDDDMWGWGAVLQSYIDSTKAIVDNQAMAGRSARTYLDEGRWDRVYDALQPGDIVLIQFGHNDGGPINTPPARGELHGAGDSSRVVLMMNRRNQVIYTYGWYIRKFAVDAIEKGAIPIVLSHTPRNMWTSKDSTSIVRNTNSYGAWARQAAGDVGAYFIDLNDISATKLERIGKAHVAEYFKNDHTHTSFKGAHLNAQSIAKGMRELADPRVKAILK